MPQSECNSQVVCDMLFIYKYLFIYLFNFFVPVSFHFFFFYGIELKVASIYVTYHLNKVYSMDFKIAFEDTLG